MDVNKNDVEGLYIGEYPTLMFYSKTNKTGTAYNGDNSFKALKEYVITQTVGTVADSSQTTHEDL